MKKKIIAGVAALLMVASCVPANTAFNFSPVGTIVASANTLTASSENLLIRYDDEKNTMSIQPVDLMSWLGYNDTATHVEVNLTSKVDEILSALQAGHIEMSEDDLKNCYVTLEAPSNAKKALSTYTNFAHLSFSDDIVDAVGNNFASRCTSLQTVDFGTHIDKIGMSAFDSCSILQGTGSGTNLDISHITYLDNNAFNNCKEIGSITFSEDLTHIGTYAFAGNQTMTELELPAILAEIDNYAFSANTKLKKVHFASNDYLCYTGSCAFANCPNLNTITVEGGNYNTLPDGYTGEDGIWGGSGIFSGCTGLQSFTWPDNWIVVPESTFSNCTNLNSFKFGTSIDLSCCQTIEKSAFSNCTALISMELPAANTDIGEYAFANCNKLEKIVVSDSLSNVERYAFAGCWVISLYPRSDKNKTKNKVVLPPEWTTVAEGTFSKCSALTQADISGITELGSKAFMDDIMLKNITIPDAVTKINSETFANCESLVDVVISPNLGGIETKAFMGCTKLETITPSDVTKLDHTLQFPSKLGGAQASAFENCIEFKYINFTEDSTFSVLGERSFAGCTNLLGSNVGGNANNTISIPVGVKDIQKAAFTGDTALDKITFLGDVATIDTNAFEKCTSLEEVVMNDSIKTVGNFAFKDCSALKKMPVTQDGKSALSNIEHINESTFENCTALEEAFIPKNIETINTNAFKGCEALKNVQWEAGSKLSKIGVSAFENCKELTAFAPKMDATVTEFPDTVVSVGDNAFKNTKLQELKIGSPVNGDTIYFGKAVFMGCPELVTADFSASNIDSVPEQAFSNCENLQTFIAPDETLQRIDKQAFYNCYRLHTLGINGCPEGEYSIPYSVNLINSQAFENNYCMQVLNLSDKSTALALSMLNIYLDEKEVQEKGYTPLEKVTVDENNPDYKSVDGILYSKDGKTLHYLPVRKNIENYVVPDSVEIIGESSLAANIYLKSVTIGDNVKEIQKSAFNDAQALEYVDFGSNGTVLLGQNLFNRRGNTEKVTCYGTKNSTIETYAATNNNIVFVDNNDVAGVIAILDNEGTEISEKTALKIGGYYQFKSRQETLDGREASDSLIWSTSDPEIATINNNGQLSVKKAGTVTITVRNANNTASKSIVVVINETGELPDDGTGDLGDVDGNGKINAADITKIAAHIKGLKKLDEAKSKRADIDKNGKINSADILKIAAHIKGIKKIGK